ncbi:hypothetical protein GN244_ATG19852 [Phytophthora infestans]|uniref:Uncharacterized protein n=1 Tax=Phytophthora infestans TaxID=4787 RepID=A0A833SI92_PHYIN|nr:hypothetical protein GN244_ATG19852 [Phytophthora infestans]
MVEREVFSDEEEERVFDRSPEGGADEQLVPVPVAVERGDGAAELRGVATIRMSSVTDVLRGLYADELKETEEGARGRTEADVDIKTEVKEEPEMKREVVAGVSARSEGLHDGWIRQRVLRRSRGVRFGVRR